MAVKTKRKIYKEKSVRKKKKRKEKTASTFSGDRHCNFDKKNYES